MASNSRQQKRFTRAEAARQLGVDVTWIWKLEKRGSLPEPRRSKVTGRPSYTEGDIARLRKALNATT